jgi:hypothetical protein
VLDEMLFQGLTDFSTDCGHRGATTQRLNSQVYIEKTFYIWRWLFTFNSANERLNFTDINQTRSSLAQLK